MSPDPQCSLLRLTFVVRLVTVTSAYKDGHQSEQLKEKLYPTAPDPARQALIETVCPRDAREADTLEYIGDESRRSLKSESRDWYTSDENMRRYSPTVIFSKQSEVSLANEMDDRINQGIAAAEAMKPRLSKALILHSPIFVPSD